MIDMSIPRLSLTFKCDLTKRDYPKPELPEGFKFVLFDGSEEGRRHWVEVLQTVGFHTGGMEKGLECFEHEFGHNIELAKKRMFFVVTDDGKYIGTCTAWEMPELNRGTMHWLGVDPEYQRYGLGKAIFDMCMYIFKTEIPEKPVYLGTQTSSHRAMCLYIKRGFFPVFWNEQSKIDYDESVKVLKGVMREPEYTIFATSLYDDSAKEKNK